MTSLLNIALAEIDRLTSRIDSLEAELAQANQDIADAAQVVGEYIEDLREAREERDTLMGLLSQQWDKNERLREALEDIAATEEGSMLFGGVIRAALHPTEKPTTCPTCGRPQPPPPNKLYGCPDPWHGEKPTDE